MTLSKSTEMIKSQFIEISEGLFGGKIEISYPDHNEKVNAEALSMFGAFNVRYYESNFDYFFKLFTHICSHFDLINLKQLSGKTKLLKLNGRILSLPFVNQLEGSIENVPKKATFFEHNLVANLFIYLHECGHLNQELKPESTSKEANHFAEFNADYYAITKILQYYYSMRTKDSPVYYHKAMQFGNEHNLIRNIIVTYLFVTFMDSLSTETIADTEDHPAIQKRFCHLIIFTRIQLEQNFGHLFLKDSLRDFMYDIFQSLAFIEVHLFNKQELLFTKLMDQCEGFYEELKTNFDHSFYFEKFNA